MREDRWEDIRTFIDASGLSVVDRFHSKNTLISKYYNNIGIISQISSIFVK